MTTTPTIATQRAEVWAAIAAARANDDGAAFEAAFNEKLALDDRVRGMVREAVDRGIDRGAPHRDQLDPLGREALHRFAADLLGCLDESAAEAARKGTEPLIEFAENAASYFAESALFPKLYAAYLLELDATGGELPVSDGVTGRAVDQAIDGLLPYARRGAGWYSHDVIPKL